MHALQVGGLAHGEGGAEDLPAVRWLWARTIQRVRQGKPRTCYSCLGTGRRRANDAERAIALGLEHKVYQRHWVKRFSWLQAGLDRLDHLAKMALRSQLRVV